MILKINTLFLYFIINKFFKKIRLSAIRNSTISPQAKINSGSSIVNSSFDKYSYCGYDCCIINTDIGSFCSIAGRVTVGGAMHPLHFVSTSPVFLSHKDSINKKFSNFDYLPQHRTKIGNDVWIGEGTLIKAGVNIGTGAVIGMGSVVTKDIPPYAIAAGNPAKIIRKRFSDELIESLLKSEWWNLPESEIHKLSEYFNNPYDFLRNLDVKQ